MSSEKRKGATSTAEAEDMARSNMQDEYSTAVAIPSTPLITVEQIPVITERLRSVKAEVDRRAEEAKSLVCNEDNYKIIKQIRAGLNKQFKAIEEQRKAVKEQVMAPYKAFEEVYKECVSDAYKAADADLKAKITEVEDSIKDTHYADLLQMFIAICDERGIPEQFRSLGDVKLSLNETEKSLHDTAEVRAINISNDLALINSQEYKDEILYEYATGKTVYEAVAEVTGRHSTMQAQAKAEEEAYEEENPWDGLFNTTTISIRVRSTVSGIEELKAFLKANNYEWRVI